MGTLHRYYGPVDKSIFARQALMHRDTEQAKIMGNSSTSAIRGVDNVSEPALLIRRHLS